MPPKSAENLPAIKELQQLFLKGKESMKGADLRTLGFDTSQSKLQIRNIKAEKDILLGNFNLSVVDKQKDLDGNPIAESKKLLHKIQSLWGVGKREIHFNDLIELNIYPAANEIKIGNILLSNYLGFDRTYSIELRDYEKNIHGKWLDTYVSRNKVIDILLKFKYTKDLHGLTEVQLNKELEIHFKNYFETVKKSDTTNRGLLDLTIGNGKSKVAIELKLSKHLKNPKRSQECRGQIEDYHKQFGSNLILVIAGDKAEMDDRNVAAAFSKAKELGVKSFPLYWSEE